MATTTRRTRHSVANHDATNSPSPEPTEPASPRTQKILDSLKVDAKPSLSGVRNDKKEEEKKNVQVYHWRGTTYEVTSDTKPEWLDQEPEKYKKKEQAVKRKREQSTDVVEVVSGDEGREAKRQKKKRASTTSVAVNVSAQDLVDDDVEESAPAPTTTKAVNEPVKKTGKKRRFSSLAVDEDEEASTTSPRKRAHKTTATTSNRPTKRVRRNEPNMTTTANSTTTTMKKRSTNKRARTTRPTRRRRTTTSNPNPDSDSDSDVAKREEEEGLATARENIACMRARDFATAGGHQLESCTEAARKRAEWYGYNVNAMTEQQMLDGAARVRRRKGQEALKLLIRLYMANDKAGELRRMWRMMTRGRNGVGLMPGSVPVSSASVRMRAARRVGVGMSPPSSSSPVQVDGATSSSPTQTTVPNDFSHAPTTHANNEVEELINPNEEEGISPNKPTSPPTLIRHDSLTHDTSPAPPPATNKAGDILRWSLPMTATTTGRAEEAITRGRMAGESHSARRRRIKRERKVVERWPVVAAGDANAAGVVE